MSYSIISSRIHKISPAERLEILQRMAVKGFVTSKEDYKKSEKLAKNAILPVAEAAFWSKKANKLLAKYDCSLPRLIESVGEKELLIYCPATRRNTVSIDGIIVPYAWIKFKFPTADKAAMAGSTIYSIAKDMCTSEKDVWAYLLPVIREYVCYQSECFGTMDWARLANFRLYDGFGNAWPL